MHRLSTHFVASCLLALGLSARLPAQDAAPRAVAHAVDVDDALRSGREPRLSVAPFAALAVGDRVAFTIPASAEFAKRSVALVVDTTDQRPGDRRSWTFRSDAGDFGHAQFVSIGDVLAGSITSGDGTAWRVVRDAAGIVRVDPLDDQHLPPCGNAPEQPLDRVPAADANRLHIGPVGDFQNESQGGSLAGLTGGLAQAGGFCSEACSTRFVDLAVFYTPNALAASGGLVPLEALLDLAVLQGNTAFTNSGCSIQMRVLGFELVDYDDAAEVGHFDHLADPSDGYLDEIPVRREALGADISSLIVENDEGWCGVAGFFPDDYHICTRFCLGSFVLAHELGHNLGACHAEGDGGGCVPSPNLLPHARGYRFTGLSGTQWRTVMAYNPGVVIPYFSTPLVTFDGYPIGNAPGTPMQADNVGVMDFFGPLVKNNGCPPPSIGTVKLLPDTQDDFDQFGLEVVLSNSQLVVSAPSSDEIADDSGSVFTFKRLSVGTCSGNQVYGPDFDTCYIDNGSLVVPDLRENDVLGSAMAATSNRLVVGAPLRDSTDPADPSALLQSGSVYLFDLVTDGGEVSWCYDTELVASAPVADARFGSSVAIDGVTVVVGAPNDTASGGSVSSFVLDGSDWEDRGTFSSADLGGIDLGEDPRFGDVLAVSGNRLAVGAPGAFGGNGAVLLYQRANADAAWQYSQILSGVPSSAFGSALSMDGDLLSVGMPGAVGSTGLVHLYRFEQGFPTGSWQFEKRFDPFLIQFPQNSGCLACEFGSSVSVDGDRMVVGAPKFIRFGLPSAGAVYLYEYRALDSRWYLVDQFAAFDPEANQLFGNSVDLVGDRLAMGAVADDTNGIQTGAAYVQFFGPFVDCNENGYNDLYEAVQGLSSDVNNDGVPDECGCLGDLNADGVIDGGDLTLLLGYWATTDPEDLLAGDLDGNGVVNAADLTLLLGNWGVCSN